MKFSRLYILGIVGFLLLVFIVEYRMPRRYNWNPTFSARSEQPFGCQLFDSVLSANMPKGYQVTRQTLYQLQQADSVHPRAIMILGESLYNMEDVDIKTMFRMAERGNRFLLAGESFSPQLKDTLVIYTTIDWDTQTQKMGLPQNYTRDSLIAWVGGNSAYPPRTFMLYPQMGEHHILIDTESDAIQRVYHALAISPKSDTWMTAMEFPIGKGSIIMVSTPLLFTNYGILDNEGRDYVMRILNGLKDLPLVRTTAYLPTYDRGVDDSPLRYFLAHPPLRWAIYLAMLTIIAFMFFTARRRQRAIPIVKEPENRSMEFVDLIAKLYEQRRDYRDITLKKFVYFADDLRRQLHIDITDTAEDVQNIGLLAHATGLEGSDIALLLSELRRLHLDESPITKKQAALYIGRMNEIVKQIT